MERLDVNFVSQGERCDGWLYLPEQSEPHPCIVIAHGIGAIRQVRLAAYAERFVQAGYAVLTFDYRHWGTSEGQPRFLCSIPRQHADIHAAIDWVRQNPQLDSERVALFGTSFGGGHAVAVAATRSDLVAVIAQCAVVDCLATALRSPPLLAFKWGVAGTIDAARALAGRPPKYMKLAGQPGEVALMSEAGAEDAYLSMIGGPSPWQNRIAARIVLALPFYRPISKAASIRAPLLMVICNRDEVCPPSAAAKVGRLAPRGRAAHFDSGHFDIYFGALFDGATKAMLEFLASSEAAPPTTWRNRAAPSQEEAL